MLGRPGRHIGTVRGDRADTPVRPVVHVVEGRHIGQPAPGQLHEQLLAPAGARSGLDGADDVGDLQDRLLAVAEDDRVDEGRDRLGVECGVPARDDDRMFLAPVGGMQRDAREIQGGQQVGVTELGGKAHPQQVEVTDRAVGVHGELGDAVLAQQILQVRPDRVGALGQDVRLLVENFVEDLDALVGKADLVGVGVHQAPANYRVLPRLDLGISFAAEIAHGFADPRQQRFQAREQRLSGHVREPTAHTPAGGGLRQAQPPPGCYRA